MPIAGLIPVASVSTLDREEKARRAAEEQRQVPLVQTLSSLVDRRWESMKDRSVIEERYANCLLQRSGKYEANKLASIREFGGSEIYLNLTSVKCRGASSWLRDTLLGTGTDKPWQLEHSPEPTLPTNLVQTAHSELSNMVMQYMASYGAPPPEDMVRQQASMMRDAIHEAALEESKKRVERMELKMEDQLVEGGFLTAFSQFIDDIVTFPIAIMKGPVPRKRATLKWNGTILETVDDIRLEWERVDPFRFYTAAWMSNVNDGPVIERIPLTSSDLEGMLGVDGYNEDAIRAVLADFELSGMSENLSVDQVKAEAEGKDTSKIYDSDTIDGLLLWDVIPGKVLIEHQMAGFEGLDSAKSYPCEVLKVGGHVVKAVLNYDPLGRKPYYVSSYEKIPGSLLGNAVTDLIKDCQQMVNGAGRALSNNMGISSGPQVGINIDRMPRGEKITNMHPWKMWQFKNADYNDSTKPLDFFQPQSNAAELIAVIEKWWSMADEISGIPRYMTGEHTPGAGRTASGLSMLINNASKGLKQVISNIDNDCLTPLIERLYQHNLRYSDDPELIGDVNIVAKGAMSLVAKESASVRRNEFLQLALTSPTVQEVIGFQGVAALLRDAAKSLDMSVNNIVPSKEKISQIEAMHQQQAAEEQAMATVKKGKTTLPDGSVAGGRDKSLMVNRVSGSNGLGGK